MNINITLDPLEITEYIAYNIIEVPVAKIPKTTLSGAGKIKIIITGAYEDTNNTIKLLDNSPAFAISDTGTVRIYCNDKDVRKNMVSYLTGVYIPKKNSNNLFEQYLYNASIYNYKKIHKVFEIVVKYANAISNLPNFTMNKVTESIMLYQSKLKENEDSITASQKVDIISKMLFETPEEANLNTQILTNLITQRVI